MTAPLPRSWFQRPAPVVAPQLLGRHLVRRVPGGDLCRVRIVETEAYEPDDPASHSFRGQTPRNASMFGAAGHLYVYLVYGIHHCLNVVTGPAGHGGAVLVRAAEPLEGLDAMRARRRTERDLLLCRGPARLAEALGIDRSFDGTDLCTSDDVWLDAGEPLPPDRIRRTVRVGLTRAAETRWRWLEDGSRWATPTPAATGGTIAANRRA